MWPHFITTAFESVIPNSDEYTYYGPWNSVLNFCFPINEGYMIAPQFPVGQVTPNLKDTVDFVITLAVMRNRATIFFVEVKAPKYIGDIHARTEADDQMRKRFHQLYNSSPSKMQGVCAFGKHLCFYEMDKSNNAIKPAPAANYSREFVVDMAPQHWWTLNLFEQAGYEKFLKVVEEAKSIGIRELNEA